MATTIKTKALDAYHTNYKIPAHGWDENVYIDYQGAVRAMRFKSVIFGQDTAVDGYSRMKFPKTLFHVVIAGVGVVTLEADCMHYFPLKYQLTPDVFQGNPTRLYLDDKHRELTNQDRRYALEEWLPECFGVQPDQLGKVTRYNIHDGSAKCVVRYKWDGVKAVPVYFDIPKKTYYSKERGWYFDEPCELPADTYATVDECRFANTMQVVEFEEDKEEKVSQTMYVTIRIDYDAPIETDMEAIAEMVCERANAHNHTIENGVTIENVEMCGINE